jgi:hypothetical protein
MRDRTARTLSKSKKLWIDNIHGHVRTGSYPFIGQAPWNKILQKTLPYVDLFLPSIEEILFMLDRSLYERLASTGDLIKHVDDVLLRDLSQQLLEMDVRLYLLRWDTGSLLKDF